MFENKHVRKPLSIFHAVHIAVRHCSDTGIEKISVVRVSEFIRFSFGWKQHEDLSRLSNNFLTLFPPIKKTYWPCFLILLLSGTQSGRKIYWKISEKMEKWQKSEDLSRNCYQKLRILKKKTVWITKNDCSLNWINGEVWDEKS